jgi:L-aspartate oxidase
MTSSILIVGGGLAGLFTALKLAPLPCIVLIPGSLGEDAASSWAQGGIAAALGSDDSITAHVDDTVHAGAGLVDLHIAHVLASGARASIEDLVSFGIPFDRYPNGDFATSREAAHSVRRVLRVCGDGAGRAIMAGVMQAVRHTPSISVYEGMVVDQLLKSQGRVIGVRAWPEMGSASTPIKILASHVILATGGLGNVYKTTTNPTFSYGSGLGMAAQIGARISDPEFVQFHPTAFARGGDPAPLITEALRGEGALLYNTHGERFMLRHHHDAELAPRDIVARGIFQEIQEGRGAFLDPSMNLQDFAERFPLASAACKAVNLNPETSLIPVVPAAHYHMGGLWTDENGQTSCPGLWAVGEVAATGAHGANRLASNSLLEAVVFGARIAAYLKENTSSDNPISSPVFEAYPIQNECPPSDLSAEENQNIATLRELLDQYVGVIRTGDGLKHAFDSLWIHLQNTQRPILRNRLYAGLFITLGALKREESRGGHYRSDFPKTDPQFAHRTHLYLKDIHFYGTSERYALHNNQRIFG